MHRIARFCNAHSKIVDVLVILSFAIFAFLYYVARTHLESDFLCLDSDASRIASYCAALDHPDHFENDFFLSESDHFRWYSSAYIPWMRAIAPHTGGYGNAFMILLMPTVWLHLSAYYLFGRLLFRSIGWAFLLTMALSCTIYIHGLWTYWGLWREPQPRFLCAALMGCLWAAAYHFRERPRAWPIIMAITGLCIYIHPVTTIPLGFSIWLGFWLFRGGRSWKFFVPFQVMCGLFFFVTASLYFWQYLTLTEHGSVQNLTLTHQIVQEYFGRAYVDQIWFMGDFFRQMVANGVLPVGLLGIVIICCRRRLAWPREISLFLIWFFGMVFVAIIIPIMEHGLAEIRGTKPTQYSLFRAIRLTVPFFLLFAVCGARHAIHQNPRKLVAGVVLVTLLIVVIASAGFGQSDVLKESIPVLLNGSEGRYPTFSSAIRALRTHTPPSSTILPIGIDANTVRYGALRPVRFTSKDVALVYSDQRLLARWYDWVNRYNEIMSLPASNQKTKSITKFAQDIGAQYIILYDEELVPSLWEGHASLIWAKKNYYIYMVEIKTKPS
jgi:hypothetical protein